MLSRGQADEDGLRRYRLWDPLPYSYSFDGETWSDSVPTGTEGQVPRGYDASKATCVNG